MALVTLTRFGGATSNRLRPPRALAFSTSWPIPTWSRFGAAPSRCPSAISATSMSQPSRQSRTAGSRSRSPRPVFASRLGSCTRRVLSRRCASRREPSSHFHPTHTCPPRLGLATTKRSPGSESWGSGRYAPSSGAGASWSRWVADVRLRLQAAPDWPPAGPVSENRLR